MHRAPNVFHKTASVCRGGLRFVAVFLKWVAVALTTGAAGGAAGTLLHYAVAWAAGLRQANTFLVFLLPAGGLVSVLIYRALKLGDAGTDDVLEAVYSEKGVPFGLVPAVFTGTVLTHLFGGSAGREGAALQLGGGIGWQIGRLFRLDARDRRIAVLCGMSGLFAALFGTPLTATFFAMEVSCVGVFYYVSLIPCLVSALAVFWLLRLTGGGPDVLPLAGAPAATPVSALQVMLLAALCAGLSILVCLSLHGTARLAKTHLKNPYVRVAAGGIAVALLSVLFASGDYNGAGMDVVARAVAGAARPEAFAVKWLFTLLTIGAGYKGGEIVPVFFIGAAFGCVVGPLIGLDPGFAAAVGMIALFCGAVNCPIASVLLSVELFGAQGLILFALAVAVSYMLSGYYGLYGSQKIVYSKRRAAYINSHVRRL